MLIYQEFGEIKGSEWFDYKRNKFITHVDTLYFTAYVNTSEWNNDGRRTNLCQYLKSKKELANNTHTEVPVFEQVAEGLSVVPFMSFGFYSLHFGKKDCFDVFIAETVPNLSTTPIVVQIRSQYLWLQGARRSFDLTCYYLEKALKKFGFRITKTQENRVDYAFHTNYIQDPVSFFNTKNLAKMQVSNFERWHQEGYFFDDEIHSDYFTLGRRTSNNVFFRVYNKSKEVIEMGYKQFFIPIWEENGLISKFDKYILEKCFVTGNYFSKEKARCEFYLEYGSNESHKEYIKELLDDKKTTASMFKKVADNLMPDMTIICNVEFQTKRKYYYNLDIPRATKDTTYKANVYNIFDLYYSIINKLTSETIRFINYKGKYSDVRRSERPTADWWLRLTNAKMFEFDDIHYDMVRIYQKNLSKDRQKVIAINNLASYAAYKLDDNSSLISDLTEFQMSLNNDDWRRYYNKRNSKEKELKKQGIVKNEYDVDLFDLVIALNDNDIEKFYK